jgi:PAS domain-containing protein
LIEYKEHINITARVLNETMLKEAQEQSAALQQAVLRLELEKTNDLHRLILDAAGDGIYGLDTNGLTTFANPSALSMKKCLH